MLFQRQKDVTEGTGGINRISNLTRSICCVKEKKGLHMENIKHTHLFKLKDVLIDVILQFLIAVVDAQLLKGVFLEVLESKHVKDTNGQALKTANRTFYIDLKTDSTVVSSTAPSSPSVSWTYRDRFFHVSSVEHSMVDAKDDPLKQSTV